MLQGIKMRKILWIVVFTFLFNNISFAELITLTKCYITDRKATNKESELSFKSFKQQIADSRTLYENKLYTLDTVTETITQTTVFKESFIERERKSGRFIKKHSKIIFKIIDLGGNVATAEDINLGSFTKKNTIDVDFVSNKVYRYYEDNYGTKISDTEKCKRQK